MVYTPQQQWTGSDSLQYSSLPRGFPSYRSATTTQNIAIWPVNDVPHVFPTFASTREDTEVRIELVVTDADAGVDEGVAYTPLDVYISRLPRRGTLYFATPSGARSSVRAASPTWDP